ncbi:hypothetical protein [Simiduia aestuariiviva]|uniref:Preprotein translocase subunit SecB n=1 Tax=Simiduia aestuariiviva TaxID=1510459 RepID=A0A839UTV6_9GAMM|nr:hypothetical protein [Simiduia aestuariiviva]MBB3170151.1 hypothetical protein [Simiduia aestuariiviva]
MNPSILQLEHYAFLSVEVRCNPVAEFDRIPQGYSIEDVKFTLKQIERDEDEDGDTTIIQLRVQSNPESKDKEGSLSNFYEIDVEAIAYISFSDSAPERYKSVKETADKIKVINGANILYGVVRDRVDSITSSMLWGRVILPLATFDKVEKTVDTSESDN